MVAQPTAVELPSPTTISRYIQKQKNRYCAAVWRCLDRERTGSVTAYLRLGEVDKTALLLGEVLRGPLFVFVDTLVLIHLNLIGAAEIIASTGRDVWHGSLENTTRRHHSPLALGHPGRDTTYADAAIRIQILRETIKTPKLSSLSLCVRCLPHDKPATYTLNWVVSTCSMTTTAADSRRRPLLNTNWR